MQEAEGRSASLHTLKDKKRDILLQQVQQREVWYSIVDGQCCKVLSMQVSSVSHHRERGMRADLALLLLLPTFLGCWPHAHSLVDNLRAGAGEAVARGTQAYSGDNSAATQATGRVPEHTSMHAPSASAAAIVSVDLLRPGVRANQGTRHRAQQLFNLPLSRADRRWGLLGAACASPCAIARYV